MEQSNQVHIHFNEFPRCVTCGKGLMLPVASLSGVFIDRWVCNYDRCGYTTYGIKKSLDAARP
jgi:hypothetical protein